MTPNEENVVTDLAPSFLNLIFLMFASKEDIFKIPDEYGSDYSIRTNLPLSDGNFSGEKRYCLGVQTFDQSCMYKPLSTMKDDNNVQFILVLC